MNTFFLTFLLPGQAGFLGEIQDNFEDLMDDVQHGFHEGVEWVERTLEEWESEFDDHLKQWGIEVDEGERAIRLDNYMANVDTIEAANREALEKGEPRPLNVNQFATLTMHEIKNTHTGLVDGGNPETHSSPNARRRSHTATIDSNGHAAQDPPRDWDWRDVDGALRSVKHQGCNNCWAHTAIDVLENRNFVKNGLSMDLSIKYVSDCQYERTRGNFIRDSDGNLQSGCNAGWEWKPWEMARDQGIATRSNYMSPTEPTTQAAQCASGTTLGCVQNTFNEMFGEAGVDNECRIEAADSPLRLPGVKTSDTDTYFKVTSFEELKWEVFNYGACSVGFGADFPLAFSAATTIFTPTEPLNHAVSVVGYGYDAVGTPYMVCKNSWGKTWGDQGFFKMAATENFFSGADKGLIRVYCPTVEDTRMAQTCTDGQLIDNKQGSTFVALPIASPHDSESFRTYSSVYNSDTPGNGYSRSMINSPRAWCASTNDINTDHYIIMDLAKVYWQAGVRTQGRHDYDQWVTYYSVEGSLDRVNWFPLLKMDETHALGGNIDQAGRRYFKGNEDRDTIVTNMFEIPAKSDGNWDPFNRNQGFRYMKLKIESFNGWPCLRAEGLVYLNRGCSCAGHMCPWGTVCSFEKGCVAPAPGETTEEPDVEDHSNKDTDDSKVEDDSPGGAAAGAQGPSGSPASGESDPWDTLGPVAVGLNVLAIGFFMGGCVIYKAMKLNANKASVDFVEASSPKSTRVDTNAHAQTWQEDDELSPRGIQHNESHPL